MLLLDGYISMLLLDVYISMLLVDVYTQCFSSTFTFNAPPRTLHNAK
jgi:hypothetical protein